MRQLIICAAMALALTACSNVTKEKLGLSKKAPNEYMVTPRAPLSLPPEYELRPVAEPAPAGEEAALPVSDEGFASKF